MMQIPCLSSKLILLNALENFTDNLTPAFQYDLRQLLVCVNKNKLEDLKVLKRSPDLLNNVKIGQGQLWLIIQTYFVLPYMGSGNFDQVT